MGEVAEVKWEVKSLLAPEVPHLGAHLAHGSNNPKGNKPVATGEIPGVNKEVAKDNNNNKVGVASNSNAKHLLTIMVAVMAADAAAVVATGTTKDNNNKEEVTLAVRIGADFVKFPLLIRETTMVFRIELFSMMDHLYYKKC